MDKKQPKVNMKLSVKLVLTLCSFGLIFCVCMFSLTTYAWLTDSVSTNSSTIKTANYNMEITLSENDVAINPDNTDEFGNETYALEDGNYVISLTAQGTATTGYTMITVSQNGADTTSYFSQQLAPGQSQQITLAVSTGCTLTIKYQWGSHGRTENVIQNNGTIMVN